MLVGLNVSGWSLSLLWACKPVSVLLGDQLSLAGFVHRFHQERVISQQCFLSLLSVEVRSYDQWSSWDRGLQAAICTGEPGDSTAFCAPTLTEKSCSPKSTDTGLQAHRWDKFQPETARPTSTRDNQMVKGKHKNPMKIPNVRLIEIEENKDSQLKG